MFTEYIFLGLCVCVVFFLFPVFVETNFNSHDHILGHFFVCLEINFHTKIYYCINSNYSNVHYIV